MPKKKKLLKSFKIEIYENENGVEMCCRTAKDFPAYELLGHLEFASKEIVLQITKVKGLIPKIIDRNIYIEKKTQKRNRLKDKRKTCKKFIPACDILFENSDNCLMCVDNK